MAGERLPSDLPIGFAHRGARSRRPDNTLESFLLALELGATALESDVWLSRDGSVVLDHDGVVRRGWRKVPISETAARDLPDHVPSLHDLYEACGAAFDLSLDVKDRLAAAETISEARAHGVADRLWLCSSDRSLLISWREMANEVHLVLSTRRASLSRGLVEFREEGIDAVNLHRDEWDASLLSRVKTAGLLAFAWDAQSNRELDRLLDLGVDAVYCDDVERMQAALERFGERRHNPG